MIVGILMMWWFDRNFFRYCFIDFVLGLLGVLRFISSMLIFGLVIGGCLGGKCRVDILFVEIWVIVLFLRVNFECESLLWIVMCW